MKNENYGDELFEIVSDPEVPESSGADASSCEDDDIRIAGTEDDASESVHVNEAAAEGTPAEASAEDDTVTCPDALSEADVPGTMENAPEADASGTEENAPEADASGTEENDPEADAPGNGENELKADVPAEVPQEMSAEEEFAEEFDYVEHEQQDEAIMEEIGDSIISQVEKELIVPQDESGFSGNGTKDGSQTTKGNFKEILAGFFYRLPKWVYVAAGCLVFIIFSMIWLTVSKPGQGVLISIGSHYIAGKVVYEPVTATEVAQLYEGEDMAYGDEQTAMYIEVPDDFAVITPEPEEEVIVEDAVKTVYNILLLGEENIDTGSARGRSDLIMIASINTEQKKIKLTSLLRDSLVAIPNHADNRINAAYTIGGISLMYDTIRTNLGIELDNYMLVNFRSFEDIINAIGGVDVELTEEEADYLNTTNYISKEQYRNVRPGKNHLNGNQALGYCRIRKVETKDHQHMDIGRTARQRRLIKSIFSSVSDMNYVELASFADKCLGFVTTDLTSERIELYLTALNDMGKPKLEELRIPVEGSFYDVRLRGMLVTNIDLKTNAEALKKFIYGD